MNRRRQARAANHCAHAAPRDRCPLCRAPVDTGRVVVPPPPQFTTADVEKLLTQRIRIGGFNLMLEKEK